jgi:hypothetical protein
MTEKPSENLKRIIESAQRLGVELDEEEALQWLTAMASQQSADDVVFDERQGIFGHKVTMLDFSPEDAIQNPDLPGRCRLFRAG